MRHAIVILFSVTLLSGCITSSSNGLTNQGQPVVATVEGGITKNIRLDFGGSIYCQGKYEGSAQDIQKTFPLGCSDGRKGTGVMNASKSDGELVGNLRFSLEDGVAGTVRMVLGETVPAEKETITANEDNTELFVKTCESMNASGKARLAYKLRANGLSRAEARRQLGSATPGTVGYIVREASLDAAYSTSTESALEAAKSGVFYCVDRWKNSVS